MSKLTKEVRCRKCNRLLFKSSVAFGEIKCPKCGYEQGFGMINMDAYKKMKVDTIIYNIMLPMSKKNDGGILDVAVSIKT